MASFHQVVAKALEANKSPEELSLQESEEKFACLALAFKTDRETLDKRIELHLRARDVAEQNIHKEMECLKDGIKVLNQSCSNNPSAPQTFAKIQTHFDVLEKSITRMSSRAEVHGAVQQELRVSQVIETMLEHVENLKRTYHTEHRELQEARQSLNDSKPDGTETPGSSKVVDRASFGPGKGCLRRVSLALMARQPKLLRNTSLQMSDSFNSSSPATAPPPPLHPSSLLFSNEFPENSSSPDAGIASAGSNQLPQQNRRYSVNQATRNGDTRTGTEDVRKRRFGTVRSGSFSKGSGGGGTSKEDGRFDVSPDQKPGSGFNQKTQTSSQHHRELLRRFLMWLVALLRLLLQRLLKVPFRDGLSFMLGAISKCHPLRVISPALIVILMFIVSAAALIVVIWTRWRGSQAIPTS